jgi:hypothetical protein
MTKYTIKLVKGRVTHDIPNEMDEEAFKALIGTIVLHLMENTRSKKFTMEIDVDNYGNIEGSSCGYR